MQTPPVPVDEISRLATLHSLNILDTAPEERFERLVRIAKNMFEVPIALVTLVDANRQWFKARTGLQVCETPRDISFCGHAILSDEIMHVEDALTDERFFDNPLVTGEPGIRFYAGCPIRVGSHRMGTFCLIDTVPRPFDEEQRRLLHDLAALAEHNLMTEHLAMTDPLTRLINRRGFEAFVRQALAVCRRLGKAATLVYFDLNGFKQINDIYGHAEGDHALKTFANGLESMFRASDAVARLGGDEFAVLLTDAVLEDANQAVMRLRRWIAVEDAVVGRGYKIEFSAGMIEINLAGSESIDAVLAAADAAMYREKRRGRAAEKSN